MGALILCVSAISGAAGCSSEDEALVPNLPERVCWGALSGKEVSRLLPNGDEATFDVEQDFHLNQNDDSTSCNLYIDGNTKLLATADLRLGSIDWGTWEEVSHSSLAVGDKGIVWDDGAASYFECEKLRPYSDGQPEGGDMPVRVELVINFNSMPEAKNSRKVIAGLMREFVEFAREELRCDAG